MLPTSMRLAFYTQPYFFLAVVVNARVACIAGRSPETW